MCQKDLEDDLVLIVRVDSGDDGQALNLYLWTGHRAPTPLIDFGSKLMESYIQFLDNEIPRMHVRQYKEPAEFRLLFHAWRWEPMIRFIKEQEREKSRLLNVIRGC